MANLPDYRHRPVVLRVHSTRWMWRCQFCAVQNKTPMLGHTLTWKRALDAANAHVRTGGGWHV